MIEVLSDRIATASKTYCCDQCGRRIQIGDRYRRQVQADAGIHTYRAHEDCDAAATAYESKSGFDPRHDEPRPLHEGIEPEEERWMIETYPAVAARLGITREAA